VSHAISPVGTPGTSPDVIRGVTDSSDAGRAVPQRHPDRPANLILVEQSGVKREIPQPSAASGIIEAEQAMHRHGNQLREIKVVSRHQAIARWKVSELGWQRVA
jgi:hypothetical protein